MSIIDEIINCSKDRCTGLVENLQKIEKNIEEIVEIASKSPKASVLVAQHLKLGEELMEKLLLGALGSPKYAYAFFAWVKMPGSLRKKYLAKAIEVVSKDPYYAFKFLKNVKVSDPKLRKILALGIARDPKRAYRAGIEFLQKAPEPVLREFLEIFARGASKDPWYAYYFALAIWVPPDMRKKIYSILLNGVKETEVEKYFMKELSHVLREI